ncbi:MAG: CsbD family protein [Deltaproteobacteria bacterium]|nr:CsbD family protein [Deltaproteobacteria bacterium]MBV8453095.1 CsbD family protein [Deltaproteobacteria bacterium]
MSGKADEIKGRVKEAVGDLTDNPRLKDSGRADKAAGKTKQAAERVINKVRDAIKKP